MRALSIFCTVLALGLAGFAYWGLETEAGRRAYDEMAGVVPLAALLASPVLGLVAVLAGWRARRALR